MNRQKSVKRHLLTLFLTLLMLATVTVAWFINWATPFTEALQMDSAALHVNVTITDEEGNALPSIDGNAIMRAENLKPGDRLGYLVNIENKGAPCRVYIGMAEIKNYFWSKAISDYEEWSEASGESRLSEVLRVSLLKPEEAPANGLTELGSRFLGADSDFYFDQYVGLAEAETIQLKFSVELIGAELPGSDPAVLSGDAAGNEYTQKKTEGIFVVNSTLAN